MAKPDHMQVNVSFIADPGAWQKAEPLVGVSVQERNKSTTKASPGEHYFCCHSVVLISAKQLLGIGVSSCNLSAALGSILVVVTKSDGFWSVQGALSHPR